jgi:hypothetical protein
LIEAGLKLKPHKCSFGMDELIYLGRVISIEGSKPNTSEVESF